MKLKKKWTNWLSQYFNDKERRAFYVLIIAVVLLTGIAIVYKNWSIKKGGMPFEFVAIDEKLDSFETRKEADRLAENILTPHRFDPNTVDSLELISMNLSPRTIYFLMNWRRKGKVFYRKEELSKLYTLSPEQYQQLEPYIVLPEKKNPFERPAFTKKPEPTSIEVNTTDSATLTLLRGIGPFYAHKIIQRRDALGGYLNFKQLKEAYKFHDSVFQILKNKLTIDVSKIKTIHINSANEAELAKHPYIKEKLAKNIILYKSGIKTFKSKEQLKLVPLIDEEKYRKIAPYITVE